MLVICDKKIYLNIVHYLDASENQLAHLAFYAHFYWLYGRSSRRLVLFLWHKISSMWFGRIGCVCVFFVLFISKNMHPST